MNVKADTKNDALDKARQMCSREEKCIDDIRKKLADWNLSAEDFDEIIESLIDDKFLDEKRYVAAFVKDKIRFNKWGKIKIAYMLRQKRIASTLISECFDEFDAEIYLEMIQNEIAKKRKTIRAKSDYDLKTKLIQFGMSRGYETEIVSKMC